MFNSERELQDYCCNVLDYKGIPYRSEVVVSESDGRADIVTDDAVIELKKTLTRDSINSAVGQALSYNATLQREKVIILGCKPNTLEALNSAETAIRLHTNAHPILSIQFWEDSEFWHLPVPQTQHQTAYSSHYDYDSSPSPGWLIGGALAFTAIAVAGWLGLNHAQTQSREGEDRKVTQTEVQHYAQIGRLARNSLEKNQDEIAQEYHKIANVTQVTCLKNFAQEMERLAKEGKLLQDNWDIFNRYVTGRCAPLEVLTDLSGYRIASPSMRTAIREVQGMTQPARVDTPDEIAVESRDPSRGTVSLRSEPNGNSSAVGKPIVNGSQVKVLERRGEWMKVRVDNRTGWIWAKQITN